MEPMVQITASYLNFGTRQNVTRGPAIAGTGPTLVSLPNLLGIFLPLHLRALKKPRLPLRDYRTSPA